MRRASMTILGLAVFAFALSAQSSGAPTKGNLTVEELYLQRRQTVEILSSLAKEPKSETKLVVLNELEKTYGSGNLTSADEDFIGILSTLAHEGNSVIARESNRKVNEQPEVRMLACRLLAKIGGTQVEKTLRTVLMTDAEPTVLAEAVYGLGMIDAGTDERITALIADLIIKRDILKPDNNLAYAALLSLEKIARARNGIREPEVFRAVFKLMSPEGKYVTEVRQKATEVFFLLRQYM